MSLVVDAGALYAQADRADPRHQATVDVLTAEKGTLVTSELALAEADYLILTRLGVEVELRFLDDLVAGTFTADCLNGPDLKAARDLVGRYRDLEIGLADASLAVLARRYRTRRLLSFDERAFRNVSPLQGGSFTLLPADQ